MFQKLQDVPKEDRREKAQPLMQKVNEDLRKSLADILKPDQLRRFNQIEIQSSGPGAFANNTRVVEALKLTDDQKDKIRSINEDLGASMRDLFQDFQSDRE